jgi:hypothetical protein
MERNDTDIHVRLVEEDWTGTLADLFAANEMDEAERAEIRAALRATGIYQGGGGAAGTFTLVVLL